MSRGARALLAALAFASLGGSSLPVAAPPVSPEAAEEAQRSNNLGVALLEQYRYDDAAGAFRRALKLDPGLALARLNLGIALLNAPDLEGAAREARAALAARPDLVSAHYVLGLAARAEGRPDEAGAAFRKVLEADPADVGARVNLGQLLLQERRYAEAVVELQAALDAEPASGTASYNLALALGRLGKRDEAQTLLRRFEALRESGTAKLIGTSYPEQGRYAEALSATGAEPGAVDPGTPAARFVDAGDALPPSARAPLRDGRAALGLFDLDGDGALDLLDLRPTGVALLRGAGGRFVDVSAEAGLGAAPGAVGALAGDCDKDGQPELLLLADKGPRLYRRRDGRFVDVGEAAGLAPASAGERFTTAAFADLDHDGDLDLVLAGVTRAPEGAAARPRLLRNDGACVFKDDAQAAGLVEDALPAVALAPSDYDNGRELDLWVLGERGLRLYHNRRDLTFRDVAPRLGLTSPARHLSLATGDFDKDGFIDVFIGSADGPDRLARRDARGAFVLEPAPLGSSGSGAGLFVDYDADGLLDLVTLGPAGLRVARNLGARWEDTSAAALAGLTPEARGNGAAALPRALVAGDLDGDGDSDLVLRAADGGLRVLRNEGPAVHALAVRLDGLASKRGGVGAQVELRAGGLWQKLETSASAPAVAPSDVVFGLGRRARADAVRVLWPSGTLQTEILDARAGARAALFVKELDRKPSSCPYLYARDGARFAFVTDFMGGGEMGYAHAPGVFNRPDPVEHVRLPPGLLRPRDGRYELRVTNELEEALFVDHLALVAVTHPADVEVFPEEGMTAPPKADRLWAVRGLRSARGARDAKGGEALERLRAIDRGFVAAFEPLRVRGYAREHALTLDLGPVGAHPLLLLTGWTDYAFSSDNVAAGQAGLALRPPALQVRDARGRWVTAREQIGIPVGRPQTVTVDLRGVFRGPSREVRIVTGMRVHWDQAQVGEAVDAPLETLTLEAREALLRERGFSRETAPDGREPWAYDYTSVSRVSPWKAFPGRYTRTGDVRELLGRSDDLFVISRPGDEIALSFDASALPAPRPGERRTFVLVSDGFSKEMDPNSATPHAVEPLPFHGMSRYPYGPEERLPWTPEGRALMERTRTRVVREALPPLALAIDAARAERGAEGRP